MASNYMISVQGRGASYAFLVTCDDNEVTARCQPCLKSGFECYIYKIEPSPLGDPGFKPEGATTLRRVWHLYDAHDEFRQEAVDIINRLDCHSVESSMEYLSIMISEFQRELDVLKGGHNDAGKEVVTRTTEEVHGETASNDQR